MSYPAYLGIRHPDTLRCDVDAFISHIRAGSSEDQIPLLVSIMERFLDEALDQLILGATRAMKLEGLSRKVVDVTISTTRATGHMLSARVLRKMKNEDVRGLAEYMDVLGQKRLDVNGHPVAFTAIGLDAPLLAEIERLALVLKTESVREHEAALIAVIQGLLDASVEALYVRTLQALELGGFASKMAEMAYHTVHKAVHALMHRVIPGLSDIQARDVVNCCYELILPPENIAVPAAA